MFYGVFIAWAIVAIVALEGGHTTTAHLAGVALGISVGAAIIAVLEHVERRLNEEDDA